MMNNLIYFFAILGIVFVFALIMMHAFPQVRLWVSRTAVLGSASSSLKYQTLLARILNDSNATADAKSSAAAEVKHRGDTQTTLVCVLGTTLVATWFVYRAHYSATSAGLWTAMLWTTAWYAAGCLGGFLFGIPRSDNLANGKFDNGAASAKTSPPPSGQLRVNTNLEQISDWLTKIIVGLGLVGLRGMPARLKQVAEYMSLGNSVSSAPMAMSILIAFTVLGFLLGYLATRMFLAPAFAGADQATAGYPTEKVSKLNDLDPSATRSVGEPSRPPEPNSAPIQVVSNLAKDILAEPATGNNSFEDRSAKATAKLLTKQFNSAADDLANLVTEKPNDLYLRLNYAWSLQKSQGRFTDDVETQLKEAQRIGARDGNQSRQLYESLTFHYLYKEPDGYKDAIRFGEEYLKMPNPLPSAQLHLNLSCAYAAQYKKQQDQPLKDASKIAAIKQVELAIGINQAMKETIKYLMDPGNAPEDDLSVFASALQDLLK